MTIESPLPRTHPHTHTRANLTFSCQLENTIVGGNSENGEKQKIVPGFVSIVYEILYRIFETSRNSV